MRWNEFVVDDHPIFRHGIVQLINTEPDFFVCGEASSAPQALSALRTVEADAAVLDVSLQGTNGIELLKQIRAEHPDLPVLMLSMHDEKHYALRALRAGAAGYTDREVEVLQLIGEGRSSREIATDLNLSVKTVESHRLHMKEKLRLKNAAELVRFAADWVAQQAESGGDSPDNENAAPVAI